MMTAPFRRLSAALADRYRLERELGTGGMATVYLAHDVKHDRKVALKVLKPELAAILGGERFLAEIRTTANLQHPHILPLHDSGEADGIVFYVMPFVEGESLRDRLVREKQLPVDEAVRIAGEVASALDYAHRHGVVHRDIKPENILLHEGQALVADFGIALAASRSDGGTRMTETGMSLGTPHYMAPEQAMGEKEITPKADIYALGCVLYEMLTGEPPFTGPTAQAIIARVMTEEPRSLVLQRHTIPPHVEAAVSMALEKLPADRFATAAQFAEALTNPAFARPSGLAQMVSGTRHARSPLHRYAAVAPWVLFVAAASLAGWTLLRPVPAPAPYRFGISFPPDQAPAPNSGFEVTRDGSRLAYVGPGAPEQRSVWVKLADRFAATPIAGTEGATNFVFSPDGEWVAFVVKNVLKKVRVTGGATVTLSQDRVACCIALAWLDDGTIVYGIPAGTELRQVPDVGGTPRTAFADSSINYFGNLTPLPGVGALLAGSLSGSGWQLRALDLRSGRATLVQDGALRGFYARTGHIVYVRPDGAVFALGFDLGRLQILGAPVPVADSIMVEGPLPRMQLSDNGTLVYRTGTVSSAGLPTYRLVWVDRRGRATDVDTAFTFSNPVYGGNAGWALSPDGTRLALGRNTAAGDDIWVKQLPTGAAVRVTFDSSAEYRPRWTPDGRKVLFSTNRPERGLYERPADGTGADSLVLAGNMFEGEISGDGRWLLARAGGTVNVSGGRDIGAMRLGTDTALTPIVHTPFDESEIALSPDGRWLAYVSDETGRPEVFIRPFPATDSAKYQISTTGGVAPLWARSGRELFFVNADRDMMGVPLVPGTAPRRVEPHVLFHLDDDLYLTDREYYTPFDVSPDGQRFIMARRVRSTAEQAPVPDSPLIVTQNWLTELGRLLHGR
jgi:hypothetical protein